MEYSIKQRLYEMADPGYRKFAASLIPNVDNVLGVRLPDLRRLAKQLAKGDWRDYLVQAEDDYFEEVMLQGMVIGCVKADPEELLRHVERFIPKINNWSVCDSFCSGLKFTNAHRDLVWGFLQRYLSSDRDYELRFCVVMLLNYFTDEVYIDRVLDCLDHIKHEGYYVKMAVAWAVSICFAKVPERTTAYLRNNTLDDFTFNKALQKIAESHRTDGQTKQIVQGMKRKPVRQRKFSAE